MLMTYKQLEAEELPLDVQNKIIEMQRQGVPLVEIVGNLKEKHNVDISEKSLRRFTVRYTETKVSDETKSDLDRSFKRAIANLNNLHGLNEDAIRRLQGEDTTRADWYNNLRVIGLNTLDCFKALYLIQGQKVSEEQSTDLGEEMDKVAMILRKAEKDREKELKAPKVLPLA